MIIMLKGQILDELKDKWGLKPIHAKILKVLDGKSMNVNEVAKATGSKKQIVYVALDELSRMNLCVKDDKGVASYSCLDFNDHLENFINYKNKEFSQNQISLIEMKKDEAIPYISKVTTALQYSNHMINMFNEDTFIRIVTRIYSVPYELYGSSLEQFKRLRNVVQKNRDVLSDDEECNYSIRMEKTLLEKHKRGMMFEYVVTARGVRSHFEILKKELGDKEFRKVFEDIYDFVKNTKGLKIFVTEDLLPTEFILSQRHLLIITKSKGYNKNKAQPTGLFVESNDMVNGYSEQFDDMAKDSVPITSFLDRLRLEMGV